MNIGFHDRGVDAEFLAVFQTELHGRLDHGLVDGFQRGRREPVEGVVAKRRDRPYRSGRSPDWVKVKNPDAPAARRIME